MFRNSSNILLSLLFLAVSFELCAAGSYQLPSGETIFDPTKPEQWQAPISSTVRQHNETVFTLNYIVASGEKKRAMINGKKVIEGDQVSGAYVKLIRSDSVVLNYKGREKELRMNKIQGIQRSVN